MILDGKIVAEKIYEDLKKEIASFKIKPILAVLLAGEDPSSIAYTQMKEKKAKELKIGFRLYSIPEIGRQDELEKLIFDLNKNEYVGGVIIQLPLPEKFDTDKLLVQIDPKKDIDGLGGEKPTATACAIMEILNYYKIGFKGKKIVLVGRGRLVGRPLAKMFSEMNLDLTVCDNKTLSLKKETLKADILISAVGSPDLIRKSMVKDGAVIIDAGTAETGGKIVGDVSEEAYLKASAYTPSKGGVGPVTVACLMKNLVEASK